MVSVGLIWRRAFLALRVGFGFDEKGRPKMNLIAPGTVAAFRFAFLELPREEPSNIAALEGAAVVLVPGCGLHAKIAHILIHALLRSRRSFGPLPIAHQQRCARSGSAGPGRGRALSGRQPSARRPPRRPRRARRRRRAPRASRARPRATRPDRRRGPSPSG